MLRLEKTVVKSIQVFRYLYPPTTGEVRLKIGTRRTLKRKVNDKDDIGEKIELKSTIQHIETFRDGVGGKITYEYYTKHKIPDTDTDYAIFKEDFHFLIFPELSILIVHGPQALRHKIRELVSNLFNEDNPDSYVRPIQINKVKMKTLINKIKRQGPMVAGAYKNNMKQADWEFPEESDHDAAENITVAMHPEHCVSDYPSFNPNYADCTFWNAKMRVYKCNGILPEEEPDEAHLDLNFNASFSFSQDVSPEQWNIFVTETCRETIRP